MIISDTYRYPTAAFGSVPPMCVLAQTPLISEEAAPAGISD